MKRVAIIPARGGSKRLPRKNIRPFHGKPIIAYPIAAARASQLFDEVIVSTDDPEISRLAVVLGAHEVIHRPAALADDYATTAAVMRHAVNFLMEAGAPLETACCIYPCTPFIRPQDLHDGYNLRVTAEEIYCFPVAAYAPAMQRALRLDLGVVEPVWPQFEGVRTQDLEPRYFDAGQWYWGLAYAWRYEAPIYQNAAGLVIDRMRAIDIDTYDDWRLAEALFTTREAAL